MARALLASDGFEIVGEAEDGESAIEAAKRLGPEVVLLDVQLPDLDGFAVASRLRENGCDPEGEGGNDEREPVAPHAAATRLRPARRDPGRRARPWR